MQPPPITKYRPYQRVALPDRRWPETVIARPPIWCSVDLRDGNQALAIPMSVEEKLEMFDLLVGIGFKEIEVGFPSASETEFRFCRRLIEENRIPGDVSIQVLVQAREHLIRRTFEALAGAPSAIVHLYNSTSPVQRKITFNKSKDEIRQIAVDGTALVKSLAAEVTDTRLRFQYSPESFSDTEVDYALEVCEAVMATWGATKDRPIILNLPATVEVAPPNVHADQIEWFCRNLANRKAAIVSLHTHNDRGCGQAATELGLMAGADRVEGTLFGNGERTGNLDIVTTGLNLYAQGVHPGLDFSDIPKIRSVYERVTRMTVPDRHPYAGDLVFTAFSGSHQDAIKKGFDARKAVKAEQADEAPVPPFEVPYLLIDPEDIGRTYEAIIRINSQSGKGGVAFILGTDYGLDLPKAMHPEIGHLVGLEADRLGRELTNAEVHQVFVRAYLEQPDGILALQDYDMTRFHNEADKAEAGGEFQVAADVRYHGKARRITGAGNGPINALVQALDRQGWKHFHLKDYRQHAIGAGSATESAAYICLEKQDGGLVWGCGIDTSIETASLQALVSAYNRAAGQT
ncbi:MAG: 2-isopropylmalate synthase [Opitutales bacterium]